MISLRKRMLLNLSTLIYAVCQVNISFITLILCNRTSILPAPIPSKIKYPIFCNCTHKNCMIHNPQQLEKALFALKIIGIVVFGICFTLYLTIYTGGYIMSSVSLCFKYGLHTYNIKT